MELMPSSRSFLSCNRLVAPSRPALEGPRHKGQRRIVCVFGGERGGHNCKRKVEVEEMIRRRAALAFLLASPALRLLEQNKKIQAANRAPDDFPNFIREESSNVKLGANIRATECYSGFQVKVVTSDSYITRDSGLMYEDIKIGTGNSPKDGQQVLPPRHCKLFMYIDTSGFEEGIRDMKPGGKRRIIIPPELGPPVSHFLC
ncbi:hypothetical protein PR202_ga25234 [Eleusine coracana subsp. coracana]|uniref:Rotamase n=1 Tax=Eleusine coracana subsp. coracana TaxID=191504 RepID=A0AAV5DBN7_ELECO|nr:hypothetical protein PR202_ga25234 [Eleusine coracana subsp. coracana]